MSYLSQLNESIKTSDRSLNFNEKIIEKKGRTDSTPSIKINVEKGRITLGGVVVETLGLDENKFNFTIDTASNEIFLYICNEKGWKPTKGGRTFTSNYLAKTLQSHFKIEENEFTVTFDVIPEDCNGTIIYGISHEHTSKVDTSMTEEVEVEEMEEVEDIAVYKSFNN